jgi:hypothetical protein
MTRLISVGISMDAIFIAHIPFLQSQPITDIRLERSIILARNAPFGNA